MKLNIKNVVNFSALALMACGMSALTTGCDDFDLTKTTADYDPRYKGKIEGESDYQVNADSHTLAVKFSSDMAWTAQILDSEGEKCAYASVSPESGEAGEACEVTVTIQPNEDIENSRSAQLQIITEKGETKSIVISQEYKVLYLTPAEIPDYEKYTCPGSWNPHFEEGPEYMLRHDAYYSWHRSKQSEHFVVFWSPEFGADPNAESVPVAMRVDIDDLLAKAEKFFDTNINKLGMAELGVGKSMLDDYKMQIYLIYQDEWLATGSGYDDKIGALWVNPSTCQPVGSTIAHEIGHSFQYQTYADRVQKQGVAADGTTGFRYGFYGPDGSGNGGCAYWEQCAQWQAQQDYPEEQFTEWFNVWVRNSHRHFHHEFFRYASYWLQSYWVEKHGVEAYGRIWKESVAPEDAISAYTRLYNGNDYSKTREELFDYAARMATYDIAGVREYAGKSQGLYNPSFVMNAEGEYQITYANCPGATGFNAIPLIAPANGGTVKVNFRGLEYGAPLSKKDRSQMVNEDGAAQGRPDNYNAVGGAENMGWRYGFVAYAGGQRTYSSVGKDAQGSLSFNVPAGTELLYLVVQGSPEVYMSHGWDGDESNDPQFPYAITLEGTDLVNYDEPAEASYEVVDGNLIGSLTVSVAASNEDWVFAEYDIAEQAVLDYFGLSAEEFEASLIAPEVGSEQVATEGKIIVLNENADGTLASSPTANVGYWCDAQGTAVNWGNGQVVYYELYGTVLNLGKLGSDAGEPGDMIAMHPVFVYTSNGQTKTLKFNITYKFK